MKTAGFIALSSLSRFSAPAAERAAASCASALDKIKADFDAKTHFVA